MAFFHELWNKMKKGYNESKEKQKNNIKNDNTTDDLRKKIDEGMRHREDIIKLHFNYYHLAEYYYKNKQYKDCISNCAKDIDLYPEFITAWIGSQLSGKNHDQIPSYPSFKRLAIVLEKVGRFDEAIAVCERALDYGLDDGTKGGFAGRISKIEKREKINSHGGL